MIPAAEHLKANQRQLDADGCEVGVSRQALDETLADLAASTAREAALREALRARAVAVALARTDEHGAEGSRIWGCDECGMRWVEGAPESAAPGCLAAMPETSGEK